MSDAVMSSVHWHDRFRAFFDSHPGFDLLSFDFHRRDARRELGLDDDDEASAETLRELAVFQRLLRVCHDPSLDIDYRKAGFTDGVHLATRLREAGFRSAHHIALTPRFQFVRDQRELLGSARLADTLHERAVQIKERVKHLVANIRDIASPAYGGSLYANVQQELVDYVREIPSYQDLFGTLDYCGCEECQSLFGPAAYFLDIMRITDQYITEPCRNQIPPGWHLEQRRPDLFERKLTCANTTQVLPFLQVVNEILERKVSTDLSMPVYQALAVAPYPFNLPAVMPLSETRAYLEPLNTTLLDFYRSILDPTPAAYGYTNIALAREALLLSPELARYVTTADPGNAGVSASYGYTDVQAHLPAAGPGTITFTAGAKTATGAGVDFMQVLHAGQQIKSGVDIRTVLRIDSATAITVDVQWSASASNAAYTIFPIEDLSSVSVFLSRTGLTLDQLNALFLQGLSVKELADGVANSFFINATGEGLPYLHIDRSIGGDTENPVQRIAGLSLKRLDRISRFARLANATQMPAATLDWLMVTVGAAEITNEFLLRLADITQMASVTGLSLLEVAAYLHNMKTIGRGDGTSPDDFFDVRFNNPALLKGANPYTSPEPIPFDPGRPLAWQVGETQETPVSTGTARAGSANTITLAADAPTQTLAGLSVTLASGAGRGQSRVITAYDGASKVATVAVNWTTAPDASSVYRVGTEANVVNRLSAALNVSTPDLTAIGTYYKASIGLTGPISLTLSALTDLYRLARLAPVYRLTIDEYLNLLTLATSVSPATSLGTLQTVVSIAVWLETTSLTIYELRYILTGVRSRFLRLSFTNDDIEPFVRRLAGASTETRLTAQQLIGAGVTAEQADAIFKILIALGLVTDAGIVLVAEAAYNAAAAKFPIASTAFAQQGVISEDESKEVFAILAQQHPLIIRRITETSGALGIDYRPTTPLTFLFIEDPAANQKRQRVATVLTQTRGWIVGTEFAPAVPVTDASFVTPNIDLAVSGEVFDALVAAQPPIVIAAEGARTGALSATFTAQTPLSFLFVSQGAGQARTITAYDGATRTATISPDWTTLPNGFSTYTVTSTTLAGTATAGAADSITLGADASPDPDAYAGMQVALTGGTGGGQARTITAYDGATKVARVSPDWTTTPDATSTYQVGPVVTSGTAQGGSATTIVLGANASTSTGAYVNQTIAIVADSSAAVKTSEVQQILLNTRSAIAGVASIVATARGSQDQAVLGGIAEFLDSSNVQMTALLPFSSPSFTVTPYLSAFLVPPISGGLDPSVIALIDGLSRSSLLAQRLELTETELASIARRPDHFVIVKTDRLTLSDVQVLSAFKRFAQVHGNNSDRLLAWFDMPPGATCPNTKMLALGSVTNWDQSDLCQLIALFWPTASQQQANTMPALLRLQAPFALIDATGANADYLVRMSTMASLVLDPGTHQIDQDAWRAYQTLANATLAVVGARYGDTFDSVDSAITEKVIVFRRDALLPFTIWHLNKTFPSIRQASDVYQFLLIDVEMGGCMTTSYIAQGIGSVQLYMQRVRMGLETGADTREIPDIWWAWMSSYRLWEVNRRVFVYPENYIDPALRKSSSPAFHALVEGLRQGDINESTVRHAYIKYFDDFTVVAQLTHVAGYQTQEVRLAGEQSVETLYLVGRTNTTPYTYYVRTRRRTSTCGQDVWSPWVEVTVSINSAFVTPVFAFNHLFLFWTETAYTKSSKVTDNTSNSQSVWQSVTKFTFQTVNGEWVSPQDSTLQLPIRVDKNTNAPADTVYTRTMYDMNQQFWRQPYAQRIARGLPANGTLTLVKGLSAAGGVKTDFLRQVRVDDRIWVAGQERMVIDVDADSQQLLVDPPWTASATGALFKVIPRDTTLNTFPTFTGNGTISFVQGFTQVTGHGTAFVSQVSVGDDLQAAGETRTVVSIFDDTSLLVDTGWASSTDKSGIGQATLNPRLTIVGGAGTKYTEQVVAGDTIVALGQPRVVVDVVSDTELLIDRAFDVQSITNAPYTIRGTVAYSVIPRTNGDEQLVMFYGAGLDVALAPPPNAAVTYASVLPNPGDDPFIASMNTYNDQMYQTLQVADIARSDTLKGSVTAERTSVLTQELLQSNGRIVAVDYNPLISKTSVPVRLYLSRQNDLLSVARGDSLLTNVFWSNDVPSTIPFVPKPTDGRPLMYHVSGTESSLYGVGNRVGWYLFNNQSDGYLVNLVDPATDFLGSMAFLRSYALPKTRNDLRLDFGSYTTSNIPYETMTFRVQRLTTSVASKLRSRLFMGGVDLLLTLDSQTLAEIPFNSFYEVPGSATPPATLDARDVPPPLMDFNGAYGPYFWEVFYFSPLLVADTLKLNRRFEDAKAWYEYIFNPTGAPRPDDDHPHDRYWNFLPFRSMDIPTLTEILTNQCQIDAYNDDPFNPDAIASMRISAYAKASVIKYIDNLIQWADALYATDTREAIDSATNLYVLANELLGERPVMVEECPRPVPKSFNEIKAQYPDGIPEFLIQAENSSLVTACPTCTQFAEVPFNEIDSYFCVPVNADLLKMWDTIEDRLFKIRHCLNIQGIARPLALFAPPLNPRAVIQAFGAAGTSMPFGLFADAPIPPFRFGYLISQAKSVLGDVTRLGASLLSALQQKDTEALAQLRLTQEAALLNLNLLVRQQAVAQVDAQRDALTESRAGADARRKHYQDLIDAGLLPQEITQVVMIGVATAFSTISTILKTAAAIGYAVPQAGSPFAMTYGGQQIGANLQTASGALDVAAAIASYTAQSMGLSSSFIRREQDWDLQVTLAEHDVKQFDAQLAGNSISKTIAERELLILQTQIAQNRQVEDFYRRRFTNEALYNWMAGQISATYYQSYQLAFDLARLAQRAYQFEFATSTDFLTFNYWDSLHKGLLAGDGLMLTLNQMEKTFTQNATRSLEIQRVISLRQLDPLAFLTFLRTGECVFELTERLFDSDYPGQYRRRIKTLSVTMPAVVGPYQNIKAVLTQVGNQIVTSPNLNAVQFLLGEPTSGEIPAGVLQSNVRNFQRIALSTGQNDTGLFQVDLNDARYLPFEGTGAVSSWKLSMAPANNPIDYTGISDVLLQLSYTALDGGEAFRSAVNRLPSLRERNWSQLLSLAQQYGSDWYTFLHVTPSPDVQTLTFATPALAQPNIRDARVGELFVKLVVPTGVNVSAASPYIDLQFNARDVVSFAPSPQGEYFTTLTRPVRVADLAASLSIRFDLTKTPAALLKNGQLNPAVLENLLVVFYLTGSV